MMTDLHWPMIFAIGFCLAAVWQLRGIENMFNKQHNNTTHNIVGHNPELTLSFLSRAINFNFLFESITIHRSDSLETRHLVAC